MGNIFSNFLENFLMEIIKHLQNYQEIFTTFIPHFCFEALLNVRKIKSGNNTF